MFGNVFILRFYRNAKAYNPSVRHRQDNGLYKKMRIKVMCKPKKCVIWQNKRT